jgi:hypothetical protein
MHNDRDLAEWARRHGGEVAITYDGAAEERVTAETPLPEQPFWLKRIRQIQGAPLTGSDFERVARAHKLEELMLTQAVFNPEDLKRLERLRSLRLLWLVNTTIDDSALQHVAGLKSLQTLVLENTEVTDAGLAHLSALTSLVELNLNGTKVTDEGLRQLAPLAQLKRLRLGRTAITGVGFQHLRHLPMQLVQLGSAKINVEGFRQLVQLKSLRHLDIAGARIDDAELASLAGLPQVSYLHLGWTRVTGPGLEHLASLPALDRLQLQNVKIDNDSLRHVGAVRSLKMLYLSNTPITDEGLQHLATLQGLHHLDLNGTGVTDAGLESIQALGNLAELHLSMTQVTAEAARRLVESMPRLAVSLNGERITGAQALAAPPAGLSPFYPPAGAVPLSKTGWSTSWSPDGKQVVYGLRQGAGLQVLDLASGQPRDLAAPGKDPRWSPDGRWIAYVSEARFNEYTNETLWLIAPDGSQPRPLGRGSFPSWIDGGKTLVFFSRDRNRLMSIDVDEPEAEPEVFFDGPIPAYASVSPDGRYLAAAKDGRFIIVDRQTGQEHPAPPLAAVRNGLATWSADGTKVLLGDYSAIWAYHLASGRLQLLVRGPYTMPALSADGTRLTFDYRPGASQWESWIVELGPDGIPKAPAAARTP